MKNEHAQALGRLGGQARTSALTPERRKEIAQLANAKRWEGHVKKPKPEPTSATRVLD